MLSNPELVYCSLYLYVGQSRTERFHSSFAQCSPRSHPPASPSVIYRSRPSLQPPLFNTAPAHHGQRFRCFPAITHEISFPGSHTFPLADISLSGPLLSSSFSDCPQPFHRCWDDLNPTVTSCAVSVLCSAAECSIITLAFAALLPIRCTIAVKTTKKYPIAELWWACPGKLHQHLLSHQQKFCFSLASGLLLPRFLYLTRCP